MPVRVPLVVPLAQPLTLPLMLPLIDTVMLCVAVRVTEAEVETDTEAEAETDAEEDCACARCSSAAAVSASSGAPERGAWQRRHSAASNKPYKNSIASARKSSASDAWRKAQGFAWCGRRRKCELA